MTLYHRDDGKLWEGTRKGGKRKEGWGSLNDIWGNSGIEGEGIGKTEKKKEAARRVLFPNLRARREFWSSKNRAQGSRLSCLCSCLCLFCFRRASYYSGYYLFTISGQQPSKDDTIYT